MGGMTHPWLGLTEIPGPIERIFRYRRRASSLQLEFLVHLLDRAGRVDQALVISLPQTISGQEPHLRAVHLSRKRLATSNYFRPLADTKAVRET